MLTKSVAFSNYFLYVRLFINNLTEDFISTTNACVCVYKKANDTHNIVYLARFN